jgi:hypothetical protein
VIKADTTRLTGILRWPTARAKRWVHDFLSRVETDLNVQAVVAIGSSVRAGVKSLDLDLVVICEKSADFVCRPPMEIDVRKFDAADVRKEIQSGNDLLGCGVRFGVILFERSKFWTNILKEYSKRLPLPSAEIARKRAEITKQRVEEFLKIGDKEATLEQEITYYTHLARAVLIEHGVYPASRPELPSQLQEIGEVELADKFQKVLNATGGVGAS